MKEEQDVLERQLWEDRRNIHRKYEEKVRVATTRSVFVPAWFAGLLKGLQYLTFAYRANMTGDTGLSKHDAEVRLFVFHPLVGTL